MRKTRGWPAALVALAALASGGCASARMKVDPAVATASDEWSVDGASPRRWDAPLAIGPYRTAAAKDAGTLGWSVPVLGLTVAATHRPFGWTMAGAGASVEAECHELGEDARTTTEVAAGVRRAPGRPVLACAFRLGTPGGGGATWQLALRTSGALAPGYAGVLRDGASGAEYEVTSSHELEGTSVRTGEPAGYVLVRGGEAVALVETLGRGRVWVARGTRDRPVIAAAGAALLLFRGVWR